MNLQSSFMVGALFGLLAGACAFVISYSEYKRNWTFSGSPSRMALRSALVTFVFFCLAGMILPWIFQLVVAK